VRAAASSVNCILATGCKKVNAYCNRLQRRSGLASGPKRRAHFGGLMRQRRSGGSTLRSAGPQTPAPVKRQTARHGERSGVLWFILPDFAFNVSRLHSPMAETFWSNFGTER